MSFRYYLNVMKQKVFQNSKFQSANTSNNTSNTNLFENLGRLTTSKPDNNKEKIEQPVRNNRYIK